MKILFILIAIYFVLKLVTKHVAPLLLMYLSKKMSKKFADQFGQHNTNQNDTTFSSNRTVDQQKPKKVVGEYIDYEEIEE